MGFRTVAEVASELGVDRSTVSAFINTGELKASNVAKSAASRKPRWRISDQQLEAFLKQREKTVVTASKTTRNRPSNRHSLPEGTRNYVDED